jgi:hypothetical protein
MKRPFADSNHLELWLLVFLVRGTEQSNAFGLRLLSSLFVSLAAVVTAKDETT